MKKKILIAYASYGTGHKSVAKYIYDYYNNQNNDYELKLLDLSDYNNRIGKISELIFNVNFKYRGSLFFSMFFNFFNHKASSAPTKEIFDKIYNMKRLSKDIADFNPDLSICSLFIPSILISKLNKKKIINSKIVTIVTDYYAHEMWTKNFDNEEALIVANEIVKNNLIDRGLDEKKIYPFGIPISDKYNERLARKSKTYQKYDLQDNIPTILFYGGGSLGSMYTYEYLKKIHDLKEDFQLIFVSGKNEELRRKCAKLTNGYNNIKVLGWTDDGINLMNIADFIITKPGGLTVTECLEMKKPMLLVPGSGGQETYNAKFLCRRGYAIRCKSMFSFKRNFIKLITRPNLLRNMNKRVKKYEENTSIEQLYKLTQKILKEK